MLRDVQPAMALPELVGPMTAATPSLSISSVQVSGSISAARPWSSRMTTQQLAAKDPALGIEILDGGLKPVAPGDAEFGCATLTDRHCTRS